MWRKLLASLQAADPSEESKDIVEDGDDVENALGDELGLLSDVDWLEDGDACISLLYFAVYEVWSMVKSPLTLRPKPPIPGLFLFML